MNRQLGIPSDDGDIKRLMDSNKIQYGKITIVCNDCVEVFSDKNRIYPEQDDLKKSLKDIYKMKPKERINWLKDYQALRALTKGL